MTQKGIAAALLALLCAAFIGAQARFFDDPYIWDGLYYIASSARAVYLYPAEVIPHGPWDNGHPPLLFWILAATWWLAGPHLWASHLVMLLFGLAALVLTFALGRSLFGPRAGLLAGIFLAVHPLFFYQTGTLSLDVPVAAFSLAALLAAVRGRWALAAAAACAMVLTRESAAVFLPALAAASVLLGKERGRARWAGPALLVLAPVLLLGCWYLFHQQVVGWWLYSDRSRAVKLGLSDLLWPLPYEIYRRTLRPFLRDHGQWALMLLVAAGLGWEWLRRRERPLTREAWVLAGAWAGFLIPIGTIIALMSFYLPRYILPAVPLFCLLAGWSVSRAGRAGVVLAGLAILPLIVAHEGPPIPGWESNRGHLGVMELNRKASRWLEEHHPDARVLARWPLWQQLCDPVYGYVSEPITVVVIGNTERFKWYCPQGRYVRVPRSRAERFGADDFDLLWVSPNDAASKRYGWLEERIDLRVAGRVEHEGLQVFFYAPDRRSGPPAEGSEAHPAR